MNMQTINRSSQRRPLSLLVKSRVQSRVVFVDLLDISEGGCKIKARAGFGTIGDRVVMKLGGVNAPLGVIAWVSGEYAGVSFEGEMHPAVVDYLCEQNGSKLGTSFSEKHGTSSTRIV